MQNLRLVYDAEDFPNFFGVTFRDVVTDKDHEFIIFSDKQDDRHNINDVARLIEFLEKQAQWLIGYNSAEYDDLMLMFIITNGARFRKAHPNLITQELYEFSAMLVTRRRGEQPPPIIFTIKRKRKPWKMLDLILLFNTIDRKSLKQLGINLKWPLLQDLPFHPGHIVLREEIPIIMKYNRNDVGITNAVMIEQTTEINNRIMYSKRYGVDLMNSCESDVGKKLVASFYEKATGIPYKEFSEKRTGYHKLALVDCLADRIKFTTPTYGRIYDKTKETVIDPNKKKEPGKQKKKQFEIIVKSKYLTHTMGIGGLHSNNPAEILTESEKFAYIDLDVASYYPWIICTENLFPRHLGPAFNSVYKEQIVDERMRIRKAEPVASYMLKIAANAVYGLTKSIYSWMYDPRMTTYICVSGELFLLMLMEGIERMTNAVIVYSNTDGLTARVPRNEIGKFYKVCHHWESYTGFQLEFNYYKKMIFRDVNNFLVFSYNTDPEKAIKAKGAYVYKRPIYESYVYPIIARSVQDYFSKGIAVEDTIMKENSIYEFMKAERTDIHKFDVVLKRVAEMDVLQKNNRWVVTKGNPKEGKLVKISKTTREQTEMQAGYLATIVNDVHDEEAHHYNLNYDFYIDKAKSMINLTQDSDTDTHIRPEYVQTNFQFG